MIAVNFFPEHNTYNVLYMLNIYQFTQFIYCVVRCKVACTKILNYLFFLLFKKLCLPCKNAVNYDTYGT
jgi:hypothetical protein